jgi:hypothetical protein
MSNNSMSDPLSLTCDFEFSDADFADISSTLLSIDEEVTSE